MIDSTPRWHYYDVKFILFAIANFLSSGQRGHGHFRGTPPGREQTWTVTGKNLAPGIRGHPWPFLSTAPGKSLDRTDRSGAQRRSLPRLEYPYHRRVLPPQQRRPHLRRPGANPGYRQQLPASQLQFRSYPDQLAKATGAGNLCQDPGGRRPEPGGPGPRQRHRPGLQPCHPAPGQCPGPGNPGHLGP